MDTPTFLISVDGTHCPMFEPTSGHRYLKNPKNYSHKFCMSGLAYEVSISIFTNQVVWINGPFLILKFLWSRVDWKIDSLVAKRWLPQCLSSRRAANDQFDTQGRYSICTSFQAPLMSLPWIFWRTLIVCRIHSVMENQSKRFALKL